MSSTTGTSEITHFDTTTPTTNLAFTTSGDYTYKNDKTFAAEWKKFRMEFLGHLLKDVPNGILKFEQIRKLNPKSGEVIVELLLTYTPDIPERKGVRNNIA